MRGARAAVLFALADGQLYVRRERHGVFPGAGLLYPGPAVAAGVTGDHGRGWYYFCAVPDILAEAAGQDGRDGLS